MYHTVLLSKLQGYNLLFVNVTSAQENNKCFYNFFLWCHLRSKFKGSLGNVSVAWDWTCLPDSVSDPCLGSDKFVHTLFLQGVNKIWQTVLKKNINTAVLAGPCCISTFTFFGKTDWCVVCRLVQCYYSDVIVAGWWRKVRVDNDFVHCESPACGFFHTSVINP